MGTFAAVMAVMSAAQKNRASKQAERSYRKTSGLNAFYQRQAAKADANLMAERAENVEEIAQLKADETRREGAYVKSRAIAVAAASGATASDKGTLNVLSEIEAETEYQALTHLFNGDLEARDLRRQAGARLKSGRISAANTLAEGNARASAERYKRYGNILSSASTMYENYGGSSKVNPKSNFSASSYYDGTIA